MSKEKKRKKEKTSIKKCTTKKCKSTQKKGNLINIVLFVILIAGIGWLGYSNGYFASSNKEGTTKMQNAAQIEKFLDANGKMLFSGAEFKIKSTEKEDGLWRSILEIEGQLQDFYMTMDGQMVMGTETLRKIMKSDKKEVIGKLNEKGELTAGDDLKQAVKKFIEKNLVEGDTKIEIPEITKEHGLIKILTTSQGNEQILYVTLNGERLVFGLTSIEEYKKQIEDQAKAQKKASSVSDKNKNDKPVVEYFVMSYCPYGTQFEKGILPVLRLFGDKIDAKMKFVNYAMHEKKELDENLAQYCIQEEQNDKFYNYLDCFLKSSGENSDAKKCVTSTGVNAVKLASCINKTDKEFKVSENYKNKSTWKGQFPTFDVNKVGNQKYGVGGSPTFVINGETISSARDSKSLLKAICSGFKNAPAECDKEVSAVAPAPGFGTGEAGGDTSGGGCGQ